MQNNEMNTRITLSILLSATLSCAVYAAPFTFETVAAYGESHERAVRWGDGVVRIWDETGLLNKHPNILRLLNKNLGSVQLQKANFKNVSQVRIKWVDALPAPYSTGCALATNSFINDNQEIGESIVRIRRNNPCLGPTEGAALMLHELGHVLGFAKHPKEGDVMAIHDRSFEKEDISLNVLQHFLKGLYSLPVGAIIPKTTVMPIPDPDSLIWRTTATQTTPNQNTTSAKTTTQKKSALPQPQIVFPNIQMRKIERKTDRGVTWEFVPIQQELPSVIEANDVTIPTKSSRFETIIPGRPTIRSNIDVIGPRSSP